MDLGSQVASGSRAFYSSLFGRVAEPNPDPQFGGYAVATLGSQDVSGIGPAQSPEQPTAWSLASSPPVTLRTTRRICS